VAYFAAISQVESEELNVARNLRSSLTLLDSFDDRQMALDAARGNSKQVYQSFNRLHDWGGQISNGRV
jgi:hypothetical protein